MKKYPTDKELEAELKNFIVHEDEAYARQSAAREARLSDPDNVERLAKIRERLDIAKMLYSARNAAKLTQAEVAEKLGVSQPFVAKLERGRGNISIDTIRRYAAACGRAVSISLL